MAKKKTAAKKTADKSRTRSRKKKTPTKKNTRALLKTLPDLTCLESVNPHSENSVQPQWIGEKFPSYVENHVMQHPLTSIREFTHKGRTVKIETSYHIEIDGEPVTFHAYVDNQGRVQCHTTPYESYASATDLVKTLLNRFPALAGNPHGAHHSH